MRDNTIRVVSVCCVWGVLCSVVYLGEGGKKKVEELEEEEESERCLTKIDNPVL